MARQAKGLGRAQAERALQLLVETDLTLRSSSRAPGMALVERALLRIASAR
jgi:DNA polymerase-3 subunit delta